MKRVKRGDKVLNEYGIGVVTNVFQSAQGFECANVSNDIGAHRVEKCKVVGFECQECGRDYNTPMPRCMSDDCPSNEELLEKYRKGEYAIRTPPVYFGNWTEMDWVAEICNQNGWTNGN